MEFDFNSNNRLDTGDIVYFTSKIYNDNVNLYFYQQQGNNFIELSDNQVLKYLINSALNI